MADNFETKLQEAKTILEKLNAPEMTLEESVEAYKKGMQALQEASKMLEEAKLAFEHAKGEPQ
jgi:exodeoxyribonuclease VII small subunit